MKFNEAMDAMTKGAKVTREPWRKSVYFVMEEDNHVRSYQVCLDHYQYDEDIMVSTGWIVEDLEGTFKFSDIIPYLYQGRKAWLSDWTKEMWIYYGAIEKYLIIRQMKSFPYAPDFDSFMAEDWLVVEGE